MLGSLAIGAVFSSTCASIIDFVGCEQDFALYTTTLDNLQNQSYAVQSLVWAKELLPYALGAVFYYRGDSSLGSLLLPVGIALFNAVVKSATDNNFENPKEIIKHSWSYLPLIRDYAQESQFDNKEKKLRSLYLASLS